MGNPFDKLKALRDTLPVGDAPAPSAAPEASPAPRAPARAVLRYERKGRGGKEATVVAQLGLDADTLDAWCREARKSLGCGGQVEGDTFVLGGDQRARLSAWLTARGVKKVVGA